MTISQRLNNLEKLQPAKKQGIPIMPQEFDGMSEEEYLSIINGIDAVGIGLLALCEDDFVEKNKVKIDRIREDHKKGIIYVEPSRLA